MNKRVGVLISGRGSNLEAILNSCERGDCSAQVAVVISNNPTAKGLKIAKKHGITAFALAIGDFPSKQAYEQEVIRILQGQDVHWVVLAGYLRLVDRDLLQAFPDRIINIHPSLLPAFKGLNAQKQALDYGVKVSGCTVHFVNEELDAGKIILQKAVPVLPDDTEDSLSQRILAEEHQLYPQAIQQLLTKKEEMIT